MDTVKSRSGWRKYTSIIIAISALLLTTVGIIAISYWGSLQSEKNTVQINASARLSTLAQDIKNNIFNIDLYSKQITLQQLSPQEGTMSQEALLLNIQTEQKALEKSTRVFGDTLQDFLHGGELETINGQKIVIDALKGAQNAKLLKAIDEVWQPYNRLIHNFSDGLGNKINQDAIAYATDYARIFNNRISALVGAITEDLSAVAGEQSKDVQYYLIIGFILASLIVFYLIVVALRQLVRSDRALARSQKEMLDMMRTLNEGLFLIDKDLVIGEQYSQELENILNTKDIAHRQFTDLLSDYVNDKTLNLTGRFLEQVFKKDIFEYLIGDLNPLSEVRVLMSDGADNVEERFLTFRFHRVYEKEEITHVLVSVLDITRSVILNRRLEKEREEHESRLEMLSNILQVDNHLMGDFIAHVDSATAEINQELKDSAYNRTALHAKVERIGRILHGLKGEASALGLDAFTNTLENFEDAVSELRRKRDVSGNNFLKLTINLDELLSLHEKVKSLYERLNMGGLNSEDGNSKTTTERYLANFANQVAERNGNKSVVLSCKGIDEAALTDEQMKTLRELSVQLLRNAIVHGIEVPAERGEKDQHGHINISLDKEDDGRWRYSFEDDGAGIDFEKIRQMASQDAQFHNVRPEDISSHDLICYLFKSGVSTAGQSNQDAGRGVGMDVVRDDVIKLGGKISIRTRRGKYTRFVIIFPAQA